MGTIRSRLIVIGLLVALSIYALVPRGQTLRVRDAVTGVMKDTTITRVPIKYGLDLVGGIHLALEVDQSKGPVADPAEAIRRAERVVRTRIDEFGTTEPVVQIVGGDRLIVELPDEEDPGRAKAIVQRTAFLEFRIADMAQRFRDALPAIDRALRAAGVGGGAAPAAGGVAQLFGGDTAKVAGDTTGAGAPFSSLLFQGSIPGEFLVQEEQVAQVDSLLRRPETQREVPRGVELMWGAQVESRGARPYRALYALENRPIITGEHLTKAQAGRSPMTNQSEVQFSLSRRGGRIFADATGRHVNDYMAIILDGRVQGQPPVIRSQIRGNGVIELGTRPLEEANDLALVLRAGALPAPLTIVEERTIGPSLGADSIRDGVRASAMAVVFVVAVMLLYYRASGALAVAAMGLYVLFALAGLALFGFTLTLPGLAGFALSIGMAVDANVLIFERMREELQRGKTVRLSVDEGFEHAMAAIIDSNVTTALTAFILYLVGTESVQGFAITLIIGIAASMITAVFVTRTLFLIWLRRRPAMTTLSI
jgi:preprotein translocase subunit SecD